MKSLIMKLTVRNACKHARCLGSSPRQRSWHSSRSPHCSAAGPPNCSPLGVSENSICLSCDYSETPDSYRGCAGKCATSAPDNLTGPRRSPWPPWSWIGSFRSQPQSLHSANLSGAYTCSDSRRKERTPYDRFPWDILMAKQTAIIAESDGYCLLMVSQNSGALPDGSETVRMDFWALLPGSPRSSYWRSCVRTSAISAGPALRAAMCLISLYPWTLSVT